MSRRDKRTAYRVVFVDGKLGRSSQPPIEPFTIEAKGTAEFTTRLLKRCRTRIASRAVEVVLELANDKITGGTVYVDTIRLVGEFTATTQT